jgi:hypothetical protein
MELVVGAPRFGHSDLGYGHDDEPDGGGNGK